MERKSGFYKALQKYGIECVLSIKKKYGVNEGFEAMKEVLRSEAEVVFVSNGEQLVGALKAMNISDKDIYIVGFDGIELPWLLNKPCAFITQPIREIGEKAAGLLIEIISNPDMKIKNIVIR